MKKYLILSLLITIGYAVAAQSADPFVTKCVLNAGNDAKYLKDFRIQLGKAAAQGELRYKANMSLWKNTKYRFTMCSTDDSKGQLFLNIKDDANKIILSSYDKKTGKTYPFVDFVCNKSGIYQLNYDFTEGQQGSGVGVVSMVK
jgi:major membrane immunogen (membrane-anchored lipoprotein)